MALRLPRMTAQIAPPCPEGRLDQTSPAEEGGAPSPRLVLPLRKQVVLQHSLLHFSTSLYFCFILFLFSFFLAFSSHLLPLPCLLSLQLDQQCFHWERVEETFPNSLHHQDQPTGGQEIALDTSVSFPDWPRGDFAYPSQSWSLAQTFTASSGAGGEAAADCMSTLCDSIGLVCTVLTPLDSSGPGSSCFGAWKVHAVSSFARGEH